MRWLKRYVRPLDYVIVVLLFIACFIPAGIFSLTEANVNTSQKVAVISVNGQVKRRIKLGAHPPSAVHALSGKRSVQYH